MLLKLRLIFFFFKVATKTQRRESLRQMSDLFVDGLKLLSRYDPVTVR